MTESNLLNSMSREYAMKNCLSELKDKYDYIIIDCMPSVSMLTTNALYCVQMKLSFLFEVNTYQQEIWGIY